MDMKQLYIKIIELLQLERIFNSTKPEMTKCSYVFPMWSVFHYDTDLESTISTKDEKLPCHPTAEYKQGLQQLVAKLSKNILKKTFWFMVNKYSLIKAKLSKYLRHRWEAVC